MWRVSLAPIAVACLLLVLVVPASSAAEPGFQEGDLIVATSYFGDIEWQRADGGLVQPLDPGFHDVSGADFDPAGRLWVVSFLGNKAVAFDPGGAFLGTIVDEVQEGPSWQPPTDISFDAKGNAFIGSFSGNVTKFDRDGNPLGVFGHGDGADSVDLAADQCTLYWQGENDEAIYQRDVCTNGPQTRRITGFGEPRGMRILPDGSLLDVEPWAGHILRLTHDAACGEFLCAEDILQVYDAPECDKWARVALSTDGTSFWSSCYVGWTPTEPGVPVPYEFDVASGAVLRTLPRTGIVLAVRGGFRAAQDRTDPTVSLTTPAQGATYTLGQPVAADYACADLGGSELASCAGNVPDGAAIDTTSVGTKTFTVTATDGAGNTASTSATYKVVYDFSGFFHPVDNPPVFNVMQAGKGVKLMFKLGGNRGLNVIEPGFPTVTAVPCGSPLDNVEKTVKVTVSKLTYEARPQQYVYFWATSNTWRGSCREFVLRLNDGSEHRALFKFT